MLIALDWTRPKDPPLSLGHASILTYALQQKVHVSERSWAVNSDSFKTADVVRHILCNTNESVDVAFGVFIWNEAAVQNILNELKTVSQGFAGRIVLGGPQISYTKGSLEMHYPQADVFIRGYAETALVELAQQDSGHATPDPIYDPIRGVHYAGYTDLNLQATVDLDTLPSPYLDGVIQPQSFIRWETQRGCKFRCSFCQHREPKSALAKTKAFALDRVHREADWILQNSVIQDIAVLDPVFNSGPSYVDILRRLRGYTGKIALQARMEMVRAEFMDEICEVNKTGNVVLEFGLQTIHKDEMRLIDRGNNMRRVVEVLTQTRERNIDTEVSLIFGLPGQTYKSFEESVNFCVDQKIKTIHAFPLMLLRGTPLHENKEALELIESNEVASKYIPRLQHGVIPHVIQSKTFDHSDWLRMADLAERLETEHNIKH
jgi:radical SAM superfamily enzyme YgiQ (UPF0313 family)